MKNRIYYVMGVSGSGKSTIGKLLASKLDLPYLEADDFHPSENIKKMAEGKALNDDDRQPWLEALNKEAQRMSEEDGAVISCSALKHSYRETLSKDLPHPAVFIYLKGSFDLILERVQSRKDHFMPAALLQSQFDILDEPEGAVVVDVFQPTEAILDTILSEINRFQ